MSFWHVESFDRYSFGNPEEIPSEQREQKIIFNDADEITIVDSHSNEILAHIVMDKKELLFMLKRVVSNLEHDLSEKECKL